MPASARASAGSVPGNPHGATDGSQRHMPMRPNAFRTTKLAQRAGKVKHMGLPHFLDFWRWPGTAGWMRTLPQDRNRAQRSGM